MELQPGDWVRIDTGEVGRVVHTARMSVFVQVEGEPEGATVKAYLLSQLTKIDPPGSPASPESSANPE